MTYAIAYQLLLSYVACGQLSKGDLFHMFAQCGNLLPLAKLIQNLLSKVSPDLKLTMKLFLFHLFPKRSVLSKPPISSSY